MGVVRGGLDWEWRRNSVKVHDVQNRPGYLVHLAGETGDRSAATVLRSWEGDLEKARLAGEGTLCRESMPQREREWLRMNRPGAAAHWNLLTSLEAEQLPQAN